MKLGLVIGGAGGIGAACARSLAPSTDLVALSGRRREALAAVASTLLGKTLIVSADVGQPAGRDLLVQELRATGFPIDWVVLASGVPLRGSLEELDAKAIEVAFMTNLVGPVLLVQQLLTLDWAAHASIVIIGSISATRPLPRRSVYAATKAGLERFGQALAADVAYRGIQVNVISAGVIDTAFLGEDHSTLQEWVDARVPARRLGRPEEVGELARYLIADAPSYLTGSRISVDGGTEAVA